jgi:phosphoribosylanthranilate isomerase
MGGCHVAVKICGLGTAHDVAVAARCGAQYVGFVFYGPSPRSISPETAKALAMPLPRSTSPVAVIVNPTDDDLWEVKRAFPEILIQLHGTEDFRRVAEIKEKFNCPIIKAVSVETREDLIQAKGYQEVADMLLFDAKVSDLNSLPGGNAVAFDWQLLAGGSWSVPWILSGGLTVENIADAVEVTGAKVVDVSSGVEDSPGFKNGDKIEEFLSVTRAL